MRDSFRAFTLRDYHEFLECFRDNGGHGRHMVAYRVDETADHVVVVQLRFAWWYHLFCGRMLAPIAETMIETLHDYKCVWTIVEVNVSWVPLWLRRKP